MLKCESYHCLHNRSCIASYIDQSKEGKERVRKREKEKEGD